jgi:5-methylcytosine-specific restriction endonuclease McrA
MFDVHSGGECHFHGRVAYCALCGRGELRSIQARLQRRIDLQRSPDPDKRATGKRWARMLRRLGVRVYTTSYDRVGHVRRMFDIDHVIPLYEGGPNHPSNLRVLCLPCHKRETAKLAARIAERRRINRGVA